MDERTVRAVEDLRNDQSDAGQAQDSSNLTDGVLGLKGDGASAKRQCGPSSMQWAASEKRSYEATRGRSASLERFASPGREASPDRL